jgi:hypothetical protein
MARPVNVPLRNACNASTRPPATSTVPISLTDSVAPPKLSKVSEKIDGKV